ncbi:acyl-CoA dehydrogenase, C-terminal domain protein [Rhodococcus sp. MTM3W5.2]|uniref:acyl-CoA dehydrogenase family protein n=1 Tax=Rhodococcus sp. MTM3W5.2 TaxID=1805827 RepID=UPI0009794221|nr:acyl-CoA dehydrogenase family protein [Rhodococcus sp. MTM3W5.2]AQA25678.1 acyl-CoA dehydrogenase, C-terminal domain protein [Rhodococcus sp. MTM3W5.2]
MKTHEVTNQVPPLVDYDTAGHPLFDEILTAAGAADALAEVHEVGTLAGSAYAKELGERAEAHPPILRTHDRYGNRVDRVDYDPAYHDLMKHAIEFGLHGAPWRDERDNAHLIRAAKFTAWQVTDAGHGCPISMTYAAVPALRADEKLSSEFEPLLANDQYDPSVAPTALKRGLIAGMSMTEKQGGSDVRANTTTATPHQDGSYRIVGHKWFTSAPMSDILLTLAQAPGGLTCFVLPRVLPDGSMNAIALQRLKDKLGNRSNASSEVEYDNAIGWRLGEEGRGVRTIIEMVNMTRLDCTLGAAALMREAVGQAAHHAAHRSAFGGLLIDKPLMRNVIADLAVEAEASTTVALWLASQTDAALRGDERAGLLRRLGLAVSKYYVCKRGPGHAAEALECLGGNGFIEESGMPRLYREAPLGSIWEGSGNVAALDTLRALAKQPEVLGVFFDELDAAAGADARYDAYVAALKAQFTDLEDLEYRSRVVVGRLALALQGSLLVRAGNQAVADAFLATRLAGDWGTVYGTLPTGLDLAPIIARVVPAPA